MPAPLRFEQRLARVLHGVLLIVGVAAVVAVVGPPVADAETAGGCRPRPVFQLADGVWRIAAPMRVAWAGLRCGRPAGADALAERFVEILHDGEFDVSSARCRKRRRARSDRGSFPDAWQRTIAAVRFSTSIGADDAVACLRGSTPAAILLEIFAVGLRARARRDGALSAASSCDVLVGRRAHVEQAAPPRRRAAVRSRRQ